MKQLMSGNEALARGAYEAGVKEQWREQAALRQLPDFLREYYKNQQS